MAWSVPLYSRSRVDNAGKLLANHPSGSYCGLESAEQIAAVDIVNNWRSSHTYPLYSIRKILENRAKKISSSAVVAQRLKRFTSIEKKLQDNLYRNMALTQIQDIGGCRAIMPSMGEVAALVKCYSEPSLMKSTLHKAADDYIASPKSDGYRSVHLVYKYHTDSERFKPFDGHKIEIQIRSALQHSWATAVEMLLTFTTIPVRDPPGVLSMYARNRDEISAWRQFFKVAATAIAMMEDRPLVPDTPSARTDISATLHQLLEQLNVEAVFSAWSTVSEWRSSPIDDIPQIITGIHTHEAFLLELKPGERQLSITPFRQSEIQRASREYMLREQSQRNFPSTNIVLVSANSLDALRAAYPNYYGDTKLFLGTLKEAIA